MSILAVCEAIMYIKLHYEAALGGRRGWGVKDSSTMIMIMLPCVASVCTRMQVQDNPNELS